MKNWKIIAPLVGAGIVVLACIVGFNLRNEEKPAGKGEEIVSKRSPKMTKKNSRKRSDKRRAEKVNGHELERNKPTFALDDDDEARLNAEQRKTIEAIRAALDMEDRPRVIKLVQTIQASDEWPDGVPKSIKMAAIEALGWFGSSCLPEIAGFLADGDPEVVQAAIEKYEEALSDIDLGDRDRSKILIQAAKVIDDPDAMDSMLSALNDMRHSVAVETIKVLMKEGTAATKQALPENVEFYTGEEGMDSAEKLDKWLQENPDDEDDEEFYGASKDV
jgi:hypothetical protein